MGIQAARVATHVQSRTVLAPAITARAASNGPEAPVRSSDITMPEARARAKTRMAVVTRQV